MTAMTVAVCSLGARGASTCVGWRRGCATTTLATVSASSKEATPVDFAPARAHERHNSDGFRVASDTVDRRSTSGHPIHGSTSENGIFIVVGPPTGHSVIHGSTSHNVKPVSALFNLVRAFDVGGVNSKADRRHLRTTTILVTTVNVGFDEMTSVDFMPPGWRTSHAAMVLIVTRDAGTGGSTLDGRWRAVGICDQ
jgi:hypothetical protein